MREIELFWRVADANCAIERRCGLEIGLSNVGIPYLEVKQLGNAECKSNRRRLNGRRLVYDGLLEIIAVSTYHESNFCLLFSILR